MGQAPVPALSCTPKTLDTAHNAADPSARAGTGACPYGYPLLNVTQLSHQVHGLRFTACGYGGFQLMGNDKSFTGGLTGFSNPQRRGGI